MTAWVTPPSKPPKSGIESSDINGRLLVGDQEIIVYNDSQVVQDVAEQASQLADKAQQVRLEDLAVNVKDYGAIGDGVNDDTVAFQTAINTKKPVKIPHGNYVITDSLKLFEGTVINGDYNSANAIHQATTKITFKAPTKRDLFILDPSVNIANYVFGISVSGLAIMSSTSARSIFNLPKLTNLQITNVNSYGYFEHAFIVDSWMDSNIEKCSFQNISVSHIKVIKNWVTTTTTFRKCYFAQGHTCVVTEEGATNSLVFDDCIFESVERVIDLQHNNNVFMYACYVEKAPKSDTVDSYLFELGLRGSGGNLGTFLWDGGIIQGYIGPSGTAYPSNAGLINADRMMDVSFSGANIARFMYILRHTQNTRMVRFTNIYVNNTTRFGLNLDWKRIVIIGGNFKDVFLQGESSATHAPIMTPEVYFNPNEATTVLNSRMFLDQVDNRMKYKDRRGHIRKLGHLSAGSTSDTFNGGRLYPGELLLNDINIGRGQPVGFVSQRFSRDTAANLYTGITTAGSPVITSSSTSNPFWDFSVNDFVTLSAGMESTTKQYRIIAKSADGTSITLDTNATASATAVAVQIPTHDLRSFGQMGYRTSSGIPNGVLTPHFIGEEVLDNTNKHWYKSVGTTNADWKQTTV